MSSNPTDTDTIGNDDAIIAGHRHRRVNLDTVSHIRVITGILDDKTARLIDRK